MKGNQPRYCKRCGFVGKHPTEGEITGGQWAGVVFLLLLFIIPGVLYLLHLMTGGAGKRLYVCPQCGARRMSIPADSPIAQGALRASAGPDKATVLLPDTKEVARSCRGCGTALSASDRFCPACGQQVGESPSAGPADQSVQRSAGSPPPRDSSEGIHPRPLEDASTRERVQLEVVPVVKKKWKAWHYWAVGIGGAYLLVVMIALNLPHDKNPTPQASTEPITPRQEIRSHLDATQRNIKESNALLAAMQAATKHPCDPANLPAYRHFMEKSPQLNDARDKEGAWFDGHSSDPKFLELLRQDPKLDAEVRKTSSDMLAMSKSASRIRARFQRVVEACMKQEVGNE